MKLLQYIMYCAHVRTCVTINSCMHAHMHTCSSLVCNMRASVAMLRCMPRVCDSECEDMDMYVCMHACMHTCVVTFCCMPRVCDSECEDMDMYV